MASSTSKLRAFWKENDPERYQAYLDKQRINNKRRRDEKKRKWAEEVHTRAMEEQRERENMLKRERNRRYREKKALESGKKRRQSRTPLNGKPSQKRRCEMTDEERRLHDNKVRNDYNQRQSHQKKSANRKKNRERMRAVRKQKKLAEECQNRKRSMLEGAVNFVKHLPKTLVNVGCQMRKQLKKSTKGDPEQYAQMVHKLATPKTPEKRKAFRRLFTETLDTNTEKPMHPRKRAVNPHPKNKNKKKIETVASRMKKFVEYKVRVYYTSSEVSRILPHKRYATKKGPAYVMIVTQRGAHKLFNAKHPELRVGYTRFCTLRPPNVRRLGSVHVETCLCLCCQNLRYKIDVLNRYLDPRDKLPSEAKLLDVILCPRNGRWHDINCIRGSCNQCKRLVTPIQKKCVQIMETEVRWTHWERHSSDRGVKLEVFSKSGSVSDLLKEMEKDLTQPVRGTSFPEHLFTAYWQQDQFKYLLNTVMPGEVLMVEDFAENRKASYSAEVKSAYFAKQQITLHPIVAYYKTETFQLVRHALIYVSDDTCHDHHLVNHITLHALEHLKSETSIMSAYIFSDGCAGQYKGKGTFADLSLMSGLKVQRAFYGSEHGKGEADGETGVLSQAMDRHIKGGNNIASAKDLFNWASSELTKNDGLHRRTFFMIPVGDVNRSRVESDIQTVPGTRKMHQVERVDDYVIKTRTLACFCCACRCGNTALCINKKYAGDFVIHKLRQSKTVMDDAFLEPPEDQVSEASSAAEKPDARVTKDCPISTGSYIRWSYTIGKKILTYNALVLEVIVPGKQIYVSCLRQKPCTSQQDGEVWVFPEIPDESTLDLEKDNIQKIQDPNIDPLKGIYIFR